MTLLRPARPVPELTRKPELDDIRRVLNESAIDPFPTAVLTGDKHLLFSASGRSFIMYQVQGRSWIALGRSGGAARRGRRTGMALPRAVG